MVTTLLQKEIKVWFVYMSSSSTIVHHGQHLQVFDSALICDHVTHFHPRTHHQD